jgi:hypothetical protein
VEDEENRESEEEDERAVDAVHDDGCGCCRRQAPLSVGSVLGGGIWTGLDAVRWVQACGGSRWLESVDLVRMDDL